MARRTDITSKRRFLKLAAGSLCGLLVPWRVAVGRPSRELLLKKSYVAGTRYYDADRACPDLMLGERLVLRRQPTNPHDDLAIEVLTEAGAKLGYVPRQDNEPFARLLDAGRDVVARVASKRTPPFAEVDIDLFLAG